MIDFDKDVKHFKRYQFDDPRSCYIGSGWLINPELVSKLDELITITGWNIKPHYSIGGGVVMDEKLENKRFCLDEHHLRNKGYCAVDFHFEIDAPPEEQLKVLYKMGFSGIGVFTNLAIASYARDEFDLLPIAFHVDLRKIPTFWVCNERGKNRYMSIKSVLKEVQCYN